MNLFPFLNQFQFNEPFLALYKAVSEDANLDPCNGRIDFDQVDPKTGFTAMHVGVICSQVKIVQRLLSKNPALISKQDLQGWTPLHFNAVIKDVQMDQIFASVKEAQMIAKTVKNIMGCTAAQLREYLERRPASPEQVVFKYSSNKEEIIEGTAKDFLAWTSANYTDQLLFNSSSLLSLWKCSPTTSKTYLKSLFDAVKLQKQPSFPLYLRKCNEQVGLGTFASQSIAKGSILWEYGGNVVSQEEFQSTPYNDQKIIYAVQFPTFVIDGKTTRNLGAMTNCGFPNAYPCFTYDNDGLPHYMLLALENTSPHAQICFDYGLEHPCKSRGYQELRSEALEAFLSLQSLSEWIKEYSARKQPYSTIEAILETLNLKSKILYILQTPSILITYLIKQKESELDYLAYLLSSSIMNDIIEFENRSVFLDDITQFINCIKKILLQNDEKKIEFILELIKLNSINSVKMLIRWFAESPNVEWHDKKEQMDQFCTIYDDLQLIITSLFSHDAKEIEKLKEFQSQIEKIPDMLKHFIIEQMLSEFEIAAQQMENQEDKKIFFKVHDVLNHKGVVK